MATVNQLSDQILDKLLLNAEQEAIQRSNNLTTRRDDPYLLGLRRDEYQSILSDYKRKNRKEKKLTWQDRDGLTYMRAQVRKLNAKLNPTPLNRLRYWRPLEVIGNFLLGRAAIMNGYDKAIKIEDKKSVAQLNIQRLDKELKQAGFKVSMEEPLRRALAQDRSSFYLTYAASDDAKTAYTLFFKKLEGTDNYYLEKFNAATQKSTLEILKGARVVRRDFSLVDEPSFSATEAANLVHQRPVAKMVDGEERWAKVDSKGKLEWTDFDLLNELRKYSIKEMENPVKWDQVINGLKSGAAREVTLMDDYGNRALNVQVHSQLEGLHFKEKNGNLVDTYRYLNPGAAPTQAMKVAYKEAPQKAPRKNRPQVKI